MVIESLWTSKFIMKEGRYSVGKVLQSTYCDTNIEYICVIRLSLMDIYNEISVRDLNNRKDIILFAVQCLLIFMESLSFTKIIEHFEL